QFVELSRGSLKRADFYLRRQAAPEGRVDLELLSFGTESTEEVAYVLKLHGKGNVSISNLSLMVMLPDGVNYMPGTMQVNYSLADDPRITGQALNLPLPEQEGDWQTEIRFDASISVDVHGELVTKARARFDSPIEADQMTPVAETKMVREPSVSENEGYVLNLKFDVLSAELSLEDRLELDLLIESWRGVREIRIAAVGHSDSQRIAPRNRHKFADNYVLSEARARSAAWYVASALRLPAESIQVEGRGPDDPVADNATAAGRQKNRRVEMILSGMRPTRPSFLEVTKASSGAQIIETQGETPGLEAERQAMAERAARDDLDDGTEIEADFESLTPGIEMLLPTREYQPAVPVTRISVKHGPTQTAHAYLNGQPVYAVNFDGTQADEASGIAVSRWRGVDLRDGNNRIHVEVRNADGSTASVLERSIHFGDAAFRGEFVEELSVLVADGKTRPVIAVRLYDKYGQPSRPGAIGAFRIDPPYRSWWQVENDRRNKLVSVGSREPIYRVGPDGVALIELEPTTQAGEVSLQLKFDRLRRQEIRTWLQAKPRDWILVGFAQGTIGHKKISDNLVAAAAAGHDDGYYDDGKIAFFAKGKIKGEYLLTVAYDSESDRRENSDGFRTQVDPNAFYALYGDQSEQRYETASQRKLYVKLERKQYLAMFGDFDTGLSVAELARYERRFNGLKIEYRGRNAGYSVFAAETDQSFVRDELRGDGTSGLYQLSSVPIIANSESVRIEIRDRFDTGRVLSSDKLNRFLDYNLDTLDGTLYFKKPVPSRDASFNPVFIVVEYESNASANEDVIAGGRMSLRSSSDALEVGVTHINEGQQGAEADLSGVDFRWQATDATLVKAEYANSNRNVAGADQEGAAYSLTVEHRGEKADIRAYAREVEQNFGLGHQSAAESGVRKAGLDGRVRVTERVIVEGEASAQRNLESGTERRVARGLVRYEKGGFAASTGLAYAEDEYTDGETRTSELAEVGVSHRMFDGKLTLRANGSVAVNEDAENADYPTNVVVGVDYRVVDGVDLFAEWEESTTRDVDATMTRVGVRATPWSRAQVNTSVTSEGSEYGPRVFANVGLVQGFELNDKWLLDIGVDQTSTLSRPGARVFDPNRELASGSLSEDFLAAYVGAMYNAGLWSANTRIEHRDSDSEQRMTLLSGWYREPQSGHSLSAGLTMFTSENISGAQTTAADLKFGWAYRVAGGHWSLLDRTDLVYEDIGLTSGSQESWRFINNFNANRRLNEHSQVSLQYAFKYVKSNFDGVEITGFTDLIGVDYRRGFRPKWDGGVHASIYHSYRSDVTDYGFGVDVGYNIRDNMWLTLGYNAFGFHDSDFASARYTAQGWYLQISIKADQHFLKRIAGQAK
ncbi:MAG: OmpA family protein, partial [Woeseia sp.]